MGQQKWRAWRSQEQEAKGRGLSSVAQLQKKRCAKPLAGSAECPVRAFAMRSQIQGDLCLHRGRPLPSEFGVSVTRDCRYKETRDCPILRQEIAARPASFNAFSFFAPAGIRKAARATNNLGLQKVSTCLAFQGMSDWVSFSLPRSGECSLAENGARSWYVCDFCVPPLCPFLYRRTRRGADLAWPAHVTPGHSVAYPSLRCFLVAVGH